MREVFQDRQDNAILSNSKPNLTPSDMEQERLNLQRTLQLAVEKQRLFLLSEAPCSTALSSSDPAVQRVAKRSSTALIATLDAVAYKKHKVEETMRRLKEEMTEAKRQRRMNQITLSVGSAGCAYLIALYHDALNLPLWGAVSLLLGIIASSQILKVRPESVSLLSEAWDPRSVGVLALATKEGDADLKKISRSALLRLLPRVQASDAGFIDREQMSALGSLLEQASKKTDVAMQLSLLQSFVQIGNETLFSTVERRTRSRNAQVRELAEQCLPALHARVSEMRRNATLLRAANLSGNDASPQTLLRPATPGETNLIPPEQLLRPASKE